MYLGKENGENAKNGTAKEPVYVNFTWKVGKEPMTAPCSDEANITSCTEKAVQKFIQSIFRIYNTI